MRGLTLYLVVSLPLTQLQWRSQYAPGSDAMRSLVPCCVAPTMLPVSGVMISPIATLVGLHPDRLSRYALAPVTPPTSHTLYMLGVTSLWLLGFRTILRPTSPGE